METTKTLPKALPKTELNLEVATIKKGWLFWTGIVVAGVAYWGSVYWNIARFL